MIANKEEIRVGQVIVHILDSTVGMPVLSDTVLDYGSLPILSKHIFLRQITVMISEDAYLKKSLQFIVIFKNGTVKIL